MMDHIKQSLIFPETKTWNNSHRPVVKDRKCFGRYMAMREVARDLIYFQDDDVFVPAVTQQRLVDEYEPGTIVACYAHGENDGGYGDLPLVCAGAIVHRNLVEWAIREYLNVWPEDDGFDYYCDFAIGVQYPRVKYVEDAVFHIAYDIAQHESRLVNQPWAAELKERVTNQGRAVRDARDRAILAV